MGQLDAVTVVLNPEPFDSHYIWFSPVFDWSMVFSRKSRDEIVEKGIARQKVKVFQFPIKPSFARRTQSPATLRGSLGLDEKAIHRALLLRRGGRRPGEEVPHGPHRARDRPAGGGHLREEREAEGRHRESRPGQHRLGADTGAGIRDESRGLHSRLRRRRGKSGPNQVFETLLQCRPIVISSFLANEKETTNWVIGNKLGWLTRSPAAPRDAAPELAAQPAVLKRYQANIEAMKLRSGTPEICEFLAGLARQKRAPKKTAHGRRPCESSGTAWLRRERRLAAGSRKPRSCGGSSGRRAKAPREGHARSGRPHAGGRGAKRRQLARGREPRGKSYFPALIRFSRDAAVIPRCSAIF